MRGIYFGKDSSEKLRNGIMRLMRGRGIAYYLMEVPSDGYSLLARPVEYPFRESRRYRTRVAPIVDGLPEWDVELLKYREEVLAAVEIVRREPYCEQVFHVNLTTTRGVLTIR